MAERFESVADVIERLRGADYLADANIAGVVYLADRLEKPVLVEGPAGVGKTELAKALAQITGSRLIRLQCYEGLDEAKALYEWNYKKQLLRIQADREHETSWEQVESDIFSEPFLLTRPLLEAIRSEEPIVLLIDEVDRVEIETEALLLEVLSDFQVSIPELGTIKGTQRPIVVLTSNNTRELSEALKRRCLYLHIDYPDLEREKEIVRVRVPEIDDELAEQIARVVRSIRELDLKKAPSISETIDWARTLFYLGAQGDLAGGDRRDAARAAQVPVRHRQGAQGARSPRAADGRSEPLTVVRDRMLDVLQGFVHELRAAGLPGVDDREPRRDARGRARRHRRPRGVQGGARRHAREAPPPLACVRHRLRRLLLAVRPASTATTGARATSSGSRSLSRSRGRRRAAASSIARSWRRCSSTR